MTIKTTKPMGLIFGLLYSIALAALSSKHKRQLLAKHKHILTQLPLVAVAAGSNQFAFGKRDAMFSTFSRGENVVSPSDTNTIYIFYVAAVLYRPALNENALISIKRFFMYLPMKIIMY